MSEGAGAMSWAYWMSVGWRYFQLIALGALALGVPLALILTGGFEGRAPLLALIFFAIAVGLIGVVLAIRKSSAQSAVAAILALDPAAGPAVAARCDRMSLVWLCSGPRRRYTYWAAEGVVLHVSGDVLEVYCSVPFATPVLLGTLHLRELRSVQLSSDVIELTNADSQYFRFRLTTDGSAVVSILRDQI